MNVIMTDNSRVSVPRRKNNRYKTTVYVKFCTLAENYRYAKPNNVDFTFLRTPCTTARATWKRQRIGQLP